jgi:hypothetical protein
MFKDHNVPGTKGYVKSKVNAHINTEINAAKEKLILKLETETDWSALNMRNSHAIFMPASNLPT